MSSDAAVTLALNQGQQNWNDSINIICGGYHPAKLTDLPQGLTKKKKERKKKRNYIKVFSVFVVVAICLMPSPKMHQLSPLNTDPK